MEVSPHGVEVPQSQPEVEVEDPTHIEDPTCTGNGQQPHSSCTVERNILLEYSLKGPIPTQLC